VRSEGAGIAGGQWKHVALVYEGAAGKNAMRVYAAWIRMFVDGREVPVKVLNDGLSLPDETSKPTPTRFRIGWDNGHDGPRYSGLLDEVGVWSGAFTPREIEALFESRAIPYSLERQRQSKASAVEIEWLRDVSQRKTEVAFAKERQELDRLRSEWLALQRNAPTLMVMEEMAKPPFARRSRREVMRA
jgi:hypothetical protein